MISVALSPEGLAALLRGETIVVELPEELSALEIYVAEPRHLSGLVGQVLLENLPFLGEKQ